MKLFPLKAFKASSASCHRTVNFGPLCGEERCNNLRGCFQTRQTQSLETRIVQQYTPYWGALLTSHDTNINDTAVAIEKFCNIVRASVHRQT